MKYITSKYIPYIFLLFFFSLLLSGCSDMVLMHPTGKIGLEERSLILTALGIMLIIVIPVILMTIFFAIKYRESNKKTKFNPNWCHSNIIEFIIWFIPITIVTFLAIITWKSTHILDPSKIIKSKNIPIKIQAISMNWKWLFIYPEQKIASINEIAFPVNTPIQLEITSDSIMNSFFIPQLGSQVYAMAGMRSKLNLIANKPGKYKGISSNFSGQGFSGMKFTAIATNNYTEFEKWIEKTKKSPNTLNDITLYQKIAEPSEYNSIEYFSSVKPELFQDIINKFNKTQQKK